jgi:hypothetical protein
MGANFRFLADKLNTLIIKFSKRPFGVKRFLALFGRFHFVIGIYQHG